jgi:hypothetical protein
MRIKNTKIIRYLLLLRSMHRVNMAMSRGAATSAMRRIDPDDPRTWEFSGFSQNGEDGIIEYLIRRIRRPNRYFVEVGASDGLENNTTWLALAQRYGGMMLEGDAAVSAWCKYWLSPLCPGVECQSLFLTKENTDDLRKILLHWEPDIFSLDIDGNDYYIVQALMENGFRPKIAVVEYNSVFGPEHKLSIKYDPNFSKSEGHGKSLYFGCSLAAWRQLFSRYKYDFITVDQNGINAFFVDPQTMQAEYAPPAKRLLFQENISHAREFKVSWENQFELIKDMPLTWL